MNLRDKLIGFLNRVFDKDPNRFLALRLEYAGVMSWSVAAGFLTTSVIGGPGIGLNIDLSAYTIAGLAQFLAGQAGYTVLYLDGSDKQNLSAITLLDAGANQGDSNGDHLYAFDSVLYAMTSAVANELTAAQTSIAAMPSQMVVPTAVGDWLDQLGSFYNVPRISGETDSIYGPRIIAEVLRPKSNNVAIEAALAQATGGVPAKVTNVPTGAGYPNYNGTISYDGTHAYSAGAGLSFGLFDVEFGIPLSDSLDISPYVQWVTDIVGRLRAAGTHLRAAAFTTSISENGNNATADNAGIVVKDSTMGTPTFYSFGIDSPADTFMAPVADGTYHADGTLLARGLY